MIYLGLIILTLGFYMLFTGDESIFNYTRNENYNRVSKNGKYPVERNFFYKNTTSRSAKEYKRYYKLDIDGFVKALFMGTHYYFIKGSLGIECLYFDTIEMMDGTYRAIVIINDYYGEKKIGYLQSMHKVFDEGFENFTKEQAEKTIERFRQRYWEKKMALDNSIEKNKEYELRKKMRNTPKII